MRFLKTIPILLFTVLLFASNALAQQRMQDVVYLKNGSIIRGMIIEQVPNESIKIQTKDGNVFVFQMNEVAKMTKEPVFGRRGSMELRGEKSPGVAFLLSFLVPGLGQYYNGDVTKGVIQEVLVAGGFILMLTAGTSSYSEYWYDDYWDYGYYDYHDELTAWFYIGLGVMGGAALWSWIDAPVSASRINRERQEAMQYGHLFEYKINRSTLGLDFAPIKHGFGAKLALHF